MIHRAEGVRYAVGAAMADEYQARVRELVPAVCAALERRAGPSRRRVGPRLPGRSVHGPRHHVLEPAEGRPPRACRLEDPEAVVALDGLTAPRAQLGAGSGLGLGVDLEAQAAPPASVDGEGPQSTGPAPAGGVVRGTGQRPASRRLWTSGPPGPRSEGEETSESRAVPGRAITARPGRSARGAGRRPESDARHRWQSATYRGSRSATAHRVPDPHPSRIARASSERPRRQR